MATTAAVKKSKRKPRCIVKTELSEEQKAIKWLVEYQTLHDGFDRERGRIRTACRIGHIVVIVDPGNKTDAAGLDAFFVPEIIVVYRKYGPGGLVEEKDDEWIEGSYYDVSRARVILDDVYRWDE